MRIASVFARVFCVGRRYAPLVQRPWLWVLGSGPLPALLREMHSKVAAAKDWQYKQ